MEPVKSTSLLAPIVKIPLDMEEASMEQLEQHWALCKGKQTYTTAAEFLLQLEAGALMVIYDVRGGQAKGEGNELPVRPINDLLDVFKAYAPKLFHKNGKEVCHGKEVCRRFASIGDAYASNPHLGPGADKWSRDVLLKLASRLAQLTGGPLCAIRDKVLSLEDCPADGAFVILSLTGKVVAANCQVELHGAHEVKKKGTKHQAGLAAVEWLKAKQLEGVALVRSDAGPVTAIFQDSGSGQIKMYKIQHDRGPVRRAGHSTRFSFFLETFCRPALYPFLLCGPAFLLRAYVARIVW